MSGANEEDASLLAVIIDVNPYTWQRASMELPPMLFQSFLDAVLVFTNAFLASKHNNRVVVLASQPDKADFLFPKRPLTDEEMDIDQMTRDRSANVFYKFWNVDQTVIESLKSMVHQPLESHHQESASQITGAITLALTYMNKVVKQAEPLVLRPRILVLSASTDQANQYIPIMNAIFSAQKASIPIDVCKLHGPDSVFLQQAAHITNASYLRVQEPDGLLQYLMFAFLPDRFASQFMKKVGESQIDFRAACFCHRKIIDQGYVCPVCLSIFCKSHTTCPMCGTKTNSMK